MRQSKVGDIIFQSSESSITCIKCSKPSITCIAMEFSIETSNRKYQLKNRHQKSNRFHSENILIKDDQVKLADFGSCRGVYSQPPFTEYISTRWYRPPECLLTDGYYNHKMDYWGVGCVYFEVLALFPLFPGNNELDQVHKIHNILGTPSDTLL